MNLFQWLVSTLLAGVGAAVALVTITFSVFYPRERGEALERDVTRVESRVNDVESATSSRFNEIENRWDRRTAAIHEKVNKIYELLIEEKRRNQ